MSSAALDLGVVVVSHNSAAELPACLASLKAATHEGRTRIVVVDNASSDDGPALVRRSFPEVEWPEPMVVPPPWEGGDGKPVNDPERRRAVHRGRRRVLV